MYGTVSQLYHRLKTEFQGEEKITLIILRKEDVMKVLRDEHLTEETAAEIVCDITTWDRDAQHEAGVGAETVRFIDSAVLHAVTGLVARMLMHGVQEAVKREGLFTLSEPTCGAGGMVVAVAECMLEAGLDPSEQMFVNFIDIDPVAADMAFIQLSLLGIPAEVITGNTLTMQFSRVRYTPVYYINRIEERLKAQRRIKAMMEIMRSLSDGAVNTGP